ncbi:MAG: putative dsRNA-binding protein [bacterium]
MLLGDDALMNRREANLRRFAQQLGMEAHLELLREALTHSSYAHEAGPGTKHNERLEVSRRRRARGHRQPGAVPPMATCPRGASRLRAAIVNETSLADQARAIGLGDVIWLGKGEERTDGRDKASVLSDAYEAVVAALFLSGGLPAASRFVEGHFGHRMGQPAPDEGYRDFKTRLQGGRPAAAGRGAGVHRSPIVRGPDHAREFDIVVTLAGVEYGRGTGTSKKRAQRAAAEKALARLLAEDDGPAK